ncbi:MAG: cell division protein FtsQ/DivIB [Methylocystaceae bacterium]
MGEAVTKKPRRLGLPVALFIALVALYFFLHSSIFNITSIETSGQKTLSGDGITALSGLTTGVNIFEVDTEQSAQKVMKHPRVKTCEVVRHLPARLEIKVVERVPWAVIPIENEFLLVDEQGVVMEKLTDWPPQQVPVVTADLESKTVRLGQRIKGIPTVYRIAKALPINNVTISEYHYDAATNEVLIYTLSGTEIRVGDASNLKEKLEAWPEVVRLLNNPRQPVAYVDLRFKGHPVIRYKGSL